MTITNTTNQNPHKDNELLRNFNYNKKHGDDNSINESEAISIRMDQKWSKPQQRLIIAVSAVVLPIIGGVIAYLAMRHSAKVDFNNALAKKRLELLSTTGEIGKLIAQTKKSGQNYPKSSSEATAILRTEILNSQLTNEVFHKYFKNSHINMIANNLPPTIDGTLSAIETWKSFKTNSKNQARELQKLKHTIKQKFNMSNDDLENLLHTIIAEAEQEINGQIKPYLRNKAMRTFSSPKHQLDILNKYLEDQEKFVTTFNQLQSDNKQKQDIKLDIETGMTNAMKQAIDRCQMAISEELLTSIKTVADKAQTYADRLQPLINFQGDATNTINELGQIGSDFQGSFQMLIESVARDPVVTSYFTSNVPPFQSPTREQPMTYLAHHTNVSIIFEALDNLSKNPVIPTFRNCISVTDRNLPLLPCVIQDMARTLNPCKVQGTFYRETPDFTSLLTTDASLTVLKTEGTLTDEDLKRLYKKLIEEQVLFPMIGLHQQIVQGQNLSPNQQEQLWILLQFSRSQTLFSQFHAVTAPWLEKGFISDNSPKQMYAQYNYKPENGSLEITFWRRNKFLLKDGVTPAQFYLLSEMKMTIDCSSPNLTCSYDVPNFRAIPISTKCFLDNHPDGKVINSLRQIDSTLVIERPGDTRHDDNDITVAVEGDDFTTSTLFLSGNNSSETSSDEDPDAKTTNYIQRSPHQ